MSQLAEKAPKTTILVHVNWFTTYIRMTMKSAIFEGYLNKLILKGSKLSNGRVLGLFKRSGSGYRLGFFTSLPFKIESLFQYEEKPMASPKTENGQTRNVWQWEKWRYKTRSGYLPHVDLLATSTRHHQGMKPTLLRMLLTRKHQKWTCIFCGFCFFSRFQSYHLAMHEPCKSRNQPF